MIFHENRLPPNIMPYLLILKKEQILNYRLLQIIVGALRVNHTSLLYLFICFQVQGAASRFGTIELSQILKLSIRV